MSTLIFFATILTLARFRPVSPFATAIGAHAICRSAARPCKPAASFRSMRCVGSIYSGSLAPTARSGARPDAARQGARTKLDRQFPRNANEPRGVGRFPFLRFYFSAVHFRHRRFDRSSLPRLVERDGKAKTHLRMLRRALLLYVLGLIFYGGVAQHWGDIRFVGVLQRIAICYLFASLLFLNLGKRGLIVAGCAARRLLGLDDLRSSARDRHRFVRPRRQSRQLDRCALSAGPAVGQNTRSGRTAEHIAGDWHLSFRVLAGLLLKDDGRADATNRCG